MRTKNEILDNLAKNFRSGIYWLVNFGNGWYISATEPRNTGLLNAIEKYEVSNAGTCTTNTTGILATVAKISL